MSPDDAATSGPRQPCTNPQEIRAAARAAWSAEKYDQAESLLRDAMETHAAAPGIANDFAWSACWRCDWAQALLRFEALRARFPGSASGWVGGARALCELGRFEESEAMARRGAALFPQNADLLAEQGRIAQRRRDWATAVALFADMRARFPDVPKGYVMGADALTAARRFDEADALLATAAKRFPENREVATRFARSADRCRNWDISLQRWNKVSAGFGETDASLLACAQALQGLRRDDEVDALLRDAAARDADRPRAETDLLAASIAIARNDMPRARAALRAALARAETIDAVDFIFAHTPMAFEGWERQCIWRALNDITSRIAAEPLPRISIRAAVPRMRLKLALRDYDGFLSCLDQAPPGADDEWMRMFRSTARLLRSGNFPDFGAEKIFGIGLTKTGTTSLHRALKMLGFHASHFLNEFTHEILTLEDALLFDALTDTPICMIFETLYHMFPNARFIYTVRPMQSWLTSYIRHFQQGRRADAFNQWRGLLTTRGAGQWGVQRALVWGALYYNYPDAATAWQAFDVRVRDFFARNDPTRLLVFDAFSGDGWQKLCQFLNRPVPAEPYPWENRARGENL